MTYLDAGLVDASPIKVLWHNWFLEIILQFGTSELLPTGWVVIGASLEHIQAVPAHTPSKTVPGRWRYINAHRLLAGTLVRAGTPWHAVPLAGEGDLSFKVLVHHTAPKTRSGLGGHWTWQSVSDEGHFPSLGRGEMSGRRPGDLHWLMRGGARSGTTTRRTEGRPRCSSSHWFILNKGILLNKPVKFVWVPFHPTVKGRFIQKTALLSRCHILFFRVRGSSALFF